MALGDPYVSTLQLKAHAGVSGVEEDSYLDTLVKAVSRSVDRYCGRQFNKTTSASARLYRPSTGAVVHVDDFHTDTDLVVKTAPDADGTYGTTLSNYTLEPLNGVVDGVSGWPHDTIRLHSTSFSSSTSQPAAQVTAQWGWDAVPDDVYQATLIQAARIFGRRWSVNGLVGQGDFVFRVSLKLDPDVAMMLEPYRRPQVA